MRYDFADWKLIGAQMGTINTVFRALLPTAPHDMPEGYVSHGGVPLVKLRAMPQRVMSLPEVDGWITLLSHALLDAREAEREANDERAAEAELARHDLPDEQPHPSEGRDE